MNERFPACTDKERLHNTRKILCISHVFPPRINPLANRVKKLLLQFQKDWQIIAITDTENACLNQEARVDFVKPWYPKFLIEFLSKLKLDKFVEWFVWPDKTIFWVLPALLKGYRLCKQENPNSILVFMMPYSASLVGIGLKWLTGIPLIFSLDDSITCTDMHPDAPTWLHYHLGLLLEKFYISQADAIVYVSQFNLELAKNKQPLLQQSKFHLIRCGIDPLDFSHSIPTGDREENFEIVYTGGMNGWYQFDSRSQDSSYLKKLYQSLMKLGRHQLAKIDYRTSSPVFVGRAVRQAITQNPSWENKIHLKVYGDDTPKSLVQEVLQNQNLSELVSISEPLPHSEVIQIARQADLLLITLPDRIDGSAGGRISCKTYEYLMTDRPILAAVPQGENWDYLQDKSGVWLVAPTDVEAMSQVITQVAAAKFSGSPLRYDRTALQQQLNYMDLAKEYFKIFERVGLSSVTNNYQGTDQLTLNNNTNSPIPK
jgi:glycosyltransferase involved in cell wall biosynthesis